MSGAGDLERTIGSNPASTASSITAGQRRACGSPSVVYEPVTFPGGAAAIAFGPDGELWVAGYRLAMRDPSGAVLMEPDSDPVTAAGIAVGPDGAVWIASGLSGRIERRAPDGTWQRWDVGGPVGAVAVVPGDPSRAYFAAMGVGVGTVGAEGVERLPLDPASRAVPWGIAAATDGFVWIADEGGSIWRTDSDLTRAEHFIAGGSESLPFRIVAGIDGDSWFTDTSGTLGHVTPGGLVDRIDVPAEGSEPHDLVVDQEGQVWFTDSAALWRYTPTTREMIPIRDGLVAGARPSGIAIDQAGTVWVSDESEGKLMRVVGC